MSARPYRRLYYSTMTENAVRRVNKLHTPDSLICPYCGSVAVWKNGHTTNRSDEIPEQNYICRDCRRQFTHRGRYALQRYYMERFEQARE